MVLFSAPSATGASEEAVTAVLVDGINVPFVEGSLLQRAFFVVRTVDGRRVAYPSPHAYFGPRMETLRARAHAARVAQRESAHSWHDESSDDDDSSAEGRALAAMQHLLNSVNVTWTARRDDAIARWKSAHADEMALFAREGNAHDAPHTVVK